jgi:hypothetical protein
MSSEDLTYRAQDVDYLGFLEGQLRDLQGIETLAYELVQNADDVKDEEGRPLTSRITFDVRDDALVVENDGAFRSVDFARLQNIAGGDKRDEADTTGAFGLGFVAVYQVTDAPEIFSNGRHWRIRPDAPADRRIEEQRVETSGTRFRLPWAFDPASAVRRALRLPVVDPGQLDEFAARLGYAIETAALFLRQLQLLEVRRNGALVQHIERQASERQRLSLRDAAGEEAAWLLLNGDFAAEAEALRAAYPWQIEPHRRSQVRLALPLDGGAEPGRLFAVLPTDAATPLPFHINADFFPTTDRKRIHFGDGYQAAWNEAAIVCAARIVAGNLAALPGHLEPAQLWRLLQQTAEAERLAVAGELPGVFAAFWQAVTPLLATTPLFFTAQEQWRPAAGVRLPPGRPFDHTAVSLLAALDIPILHPSLAPYLGVMRQPQVGAAPLTVADVAAALQKAGLARTVSLREAPDFLRTLDAWHSLWQLLDGLLNRLPGPAHKTAALDSLNRCAIVLTRDLSLARLSQVYHGRAEAQALFPELAWLHESAPADAFPGRFVTVFGARQAVDRLAETPPDRLEEDWRQGRLDLPRLWRWLEAQQIEILADDPTLAPAIRHLPLCPAAGELRPLAHLYLPGDFDDPLSLAGLIDLDAIGGRAQFLRDLGARELTFETYVRRELPRVLAQDPDLPSDARHRLLQLLAARLGEIRDDELLQRQLQRLPLIPTMDGAFRPAERVYASREVMALLGDRVHVAEPAPSHAVQALYEWLGVGQEATAADVAQALLALSQAWPGIPLDTAAQAQAWRAWERLNAVASELPAETAAALRDQPVLPNRLGVLVRAGRLLWPDQEEIAGRFADLDAYLLPEGLWGPAVAAVGVRPLSQAVTVQYVFPAEAVAAEQVALALRLRERRPLIERLLRAEGGDTLAAAAAILDELRVIQTPRLQLQYELRLGDDRFNSGLEPLMVKLDLQTKTLLVTGEAGEQPWAAIARELAAALKSPGAPATLALGLRQLLAAASFAEAEQVLDELEM